MTNESSKYKERLFAAITWLRFPLIFLIIMLHCYSVQRLEGDHETYFKVVYPFALWLGETGVPGFFFISGYLYFLSKKSYRKKLGDRVYTLLIPYLLWNLLLLLLYLIIWAFGHPLVIFKTNIADYGWVDFLRAFWDRGVFNYGNSAPLLCPLWYIRNLLIMSILSPIIYYIVRYAREFFLIAVAAWWMTTNNNAFTPQTILFFSLGGYFSIFDINPLKMVSDKKFLFLTLALSFAIADIFVHVAYGTHFNLIIHRMALLLNIPALLLLADYMDRYHNKQMDFLSQSAFIVFCIHYPIVLILRKICVIFFAGASDAIHIPLYFLCVILTTLMSLSFYCALNKYCPKAKSILSGNR